MIDIAIVRRSGGGVRGVSPWVLLDRLRTLSRGPFCISGRLAVGGPKNKLLWALYNFLPMGRLAVARGPFGPWRAGRGDGLEKLRAL